MSTQNHRRISFQISKSQEHCRLLELPKPLLDLIQNETPPNLHFKSSAQAASTPTTRNAGNAVLCTENATYQLRQVHTSNSILVLQPSQGIESSSGNGEPVPDGDVLAIAKCPTILELIPCIPAATAHLESVLSKYAKEPYIPPHCGDSLCLNAEQGHQNRNAILNDAPFSHKEFDAAWEELCAFERNGHAYIPFDGVLHAIWKSIVSAAALKGIKLDESLYVSSIAGLVEEDGFPPELLSAVVRRLSTDQIVPMKGWVNLDAGKCVPWVGMVILASPDRPSEGMAESAFFSEWQNLLPETWRKRPALNLLTGKFYQSSKGRIMSRRIAVDSGYTQLDNVLGSGKRAGKWHEKFKNDRR